MIRRASREWILELDVRKTRIFRPGGLGEGPAEGPFVKELLATYLVAVALASKRIRMVIITRAEIEALTSGEELAALIIAKVTQIHSSGGKCY